MAINKTVFLTMFGAMCASAAFATNWIITDTKGYTATRLNSDVWTNADDTSAAKGHPLTGDSVTIFQKTTATETFLAGSMNVSLDTFTFQATAAKTLNNYTTFYIYGNSNNPLLQVNTVNNKDAEGNIITPGWSSTRSLIRINAETETAYEGKMLVAKNLTVNNLFLGTDRGKVTWVIDDPESVYNINGNLIINNSGTTTSNLGKGSGIRQKSGTMNASVKFGENNFASNTDIEGNYYLEGGTLKAQEIKTGQSGTIQSGATNVSVVGHFVHDGGKIDATSGTRITDQLKDSLGADVNLGGMYYTLGGKTDEKGFSTNVIDIGSSGSFKVYQYVNIENKAGEKGGLTITGTNTTSNSVVINAASLTATGTLALLNGVGMDLSDATANSSFGKIYLEGGTISNQVVTRIFNIKEGQILSGYGLLGNNGGGVTINGLNRAGNMAMGGIISPDGKDGAVAKLISQGNLNVTNTSELHFDILSTTSYDQLELSWTNASVFQCYFNIASYESDEADASFGKLVFDISKMTEIGEIDLKDILIFGTDKTIIAADLTRFKQGIEFVGQDKNVHATVDYDNYKLVFTAVPEASTYAVVLGVLALALAVYRRRK